MRTILASAQVLAAVVALGACEPEAERYGVPERDAVAFQNEVYPILLRDCAFPACHGAAERFFHIYGPGRTRLLEETLPYAPATPEELAMSFDRTRSMLVDPDGPRRAPLLRKPLAVGAGGAGHAGDTPYGAAIYLSKEDPSYIALFRWAIGEES